MSQSPDYEGYTKRTARKVFAGNLKEGEYQAIVRKDKKSAKRYFRAAGVKSKYENKAFKEADAAADKSVSLKKTQRKRGMKR